VNIKKYFYILRCECCL